MDVIALRDRPKMYLFSDGVAELAIGLFMLFYSASAWLLIRLPRDWGFGWGGVFAPGLVLGLSGFGMARGIKFLRERVTSPRGGYVAMKVTRYQRLYSGGAVVLMLAAYSLSNGRFSHALVCCAIFGCCYISTGLMYRLPYMFLLAAFSALLGIWVCLQGKDLLSVMLWQGAMLAGAGGVKLLRFVQSHERA